MAALADLKALAVRARAEYPECIVLSATAAGAAAGRSRVAAAVGGGLAAVALGSPLINKWEPPAGSFSWLVEAHSSATTELGTLVRAATASARASAVDANAALGEARRGAVGLVDGTEGGVKAWWRITRGAVTACTAEYPERVLGLHYMAAWAYFGTRSSECSHVYMYM